MTLFDDEDAEDFTGKVRRTWNGRPYVLANPHWIYDEDPEARYAGFNPKPGEHRGPSALYTRVTTYISCLEDTYSLGQWQERMTILGLAMRPQLVAQAQRVDLSDPDTARDELNKIALLAKETSNWKEKADLGTDFHEIAHAYDKGRRNFLNLSPESKAMLAAYAKATEDWEYAHIEQGMVNDELRTYGTPDRLRRLSRDELMTRAIRLNICVDTLKPRQYLRVTDIKTGRIDYGWQKMELQLACYALSALYDPDTGIRTELDIDQEYAEIVHVPYGQGRCDVYVIPIAEAVETLRTLVPAVRAWRARKPSWVPAEAPAVTSGVAAAWPVEAPEAL